MRECHLFTFFTHFKINSNISSIFAIFFKDILGLFFFETAAKFKFLLNQFLCQGRKLLNVKAYFQKNHFKNNPPSIFLLKENSSKIQLNPFNSNLQGTSVDNVGRY